MLGQVPWTPALVIDENILETNILKMAAFASENKIVLRPHAKTHKIAEIARKQAAAGGPGLTVATLGEAQYFFEAGVTDLFVAYPIWATARDGAILSRLASQGSLAVGTDSEAAVEQLATVTGQNSRVEIMIEVNSGHNRSGVFPDELVPIARTIRQRGMTLRGLFTFPGHSYAPGQQDLAAQDEAAALSEGREVLGKAGFEVRVLSGGSSPSATQTRPEGVTEIRPGVYVFGDAQQLELGRTSSEQIALSAVTTVVSRQEERGGTPGRIIIDAGSKVLGADRASWASGHGHILGHPQARIVALSEHHGTVHWDDRELPSIGSRLQVVPNHVCSAVNLVDEVHVSDGKNIVNTWHVGARGLNS